MEIIAKVVVTTIDMMLAVMILLASKKLKNAELYGAIVFILINILAIWWR